MSSIKHTAKARAQSSLKPRKVVIVDSRDHSRAGGAMSDRDFLIWLHNRMEHVHGETPIVDYMHKLRAMIASTPLDQATPNDGRGQNSMQDLLKMLGGRSAITPAIFDGKTQTFSKTKALAAYAKKGDR